MTRLDGHDRRRQSEDGRVRDQMHGAEVCANPDSLDETSVRNRFSDGGGKRCEVEAAIGW